MWIAVALITLATILALLTHAAFNHKLLYRGRVVIFVGTNGAPQLLGIAITNTNVSNCAFRIMAVVGLKACVMTKDPSQTNTMNTIHLLNMSLDSAGVQWRRPQ
jgi:hypothetical protein